MDEQLNVTRRKPSRFRPLHSFSLRTLLIVVTLLAIPLGWIGYQAKIVRERTALLKKIEDSHGLSLPFDALYAFPGPNTLNFVRRWSGDEPIGEIVLSDTIQPADVQEILDAFPEANIHPRFHYSD
jgi:hypothetical protein